MRMNDSLEGENGKDLFNIMSYHDMIFSALTKRTCLGIRGGCKCAKEENNLRKHLSSISSLPPVGFCQKKFVGTFEADAGCALPTAPDSGSRLVVPEPPPSSETQLPLLLLCRPQVVVVAGGRNLRLFQTTCTSFAKPNLG